MYYDPTYILVVIGLLLSMLASAMVNGSFKKYSKVASRSGYTGATAAEKILHLAGIYDVRIERVSGDLTDHYDPRSKVLRLSDSVYNSPSIAAIGVAAHECGHAIQHANKYVPLVARSTIVPMANIASRLSMPIFIAGLVFGAYDTLVPIGIILFSVGLLFQIITLPVEFNASNRAIKVIRQNGILIDNEVSGAKKVLAAAACTYVAAAIATLLQLVRLILISRDRD